MTRCVLPTVPPRLAVTALLREWPSLVNRHTRLKSGLTPTGLSRPLLWASRNTLLDQLQHGNDGFSYPDQSVSIGVADVLAPLGPHTIHEGVE